MQNVKIGLYIQHFVLLYYFSDKYKAMKKYDLQQRLIAFSSSILDLSENLPTHYAGTYLAKQIIRSGISPALNYGEAQAAESKADFIHKMRLCQKELRETQVNLRIIKEKEYLKNYNFEVLTECSELVAIFTSSIATAKRKLS